MLGWRCILNGILIKEQGGCATTYIPWYIFDLSKHVCEVSGIWLDVSTNKSPDIETYGREFGTYKDAEMFWPYRDIEQS